MNVRGNSWERRRLAGVSPDCRPRNSPAGRRRSQGFTLIEVVISSALMALILVSAYLCLHAGLNSQKLIEPRAEIIQNARVAMALLTADLRGACPLAKDFQFLGTPRRLEITPAVPCVRTARVSRLTWRTDTPNHSAASACLIVRLSTCSMTA